jgi:acylphosphatase
MKNHKTITVYGRVQGVGFRYFTKMKADSLGINGFVKNQPDGSVYIEAEGDSDVMNEFIALCRKGPALARVIKMDVNETGFAGYENFQIR